MVWPHPIFMQLKFTRVGGVHADMIPDTCSAVSYVLLEIKSQRENV